jgi:hypothetical protein
MYNQLYRIICLSKVSEKLISSTTSYRSCRLVDQVIVNKLAGVYQLTPASLLSLCRACVHVYQSISKVNSAQSNPCEATTMVRD